jgi:tetratricopeptide (TPR) repeat protein
MRWFKAWWRHWGPEGWSKWWRRVRTQLTPRGFSRLLWSLVLRVWFIILWPFVMTGRLFQAIWSWIVMWWQVRNFQYFLKGLPALIAMLGIGVTTSFAYFRSEDNLRDRYSMAGRGALRDNDINRAVLCFERLAQLNGTDPEVRFLLAISVLRSETSADITRAKKILDDLAPEDRGYYGPAHIAKAREILSQRATRETLRVAEMHLLRAQRASIPLSQDQQADSHRLLASVYGQQGRFEEAEEQATKALPSFPEMRMVLGRIQMASGKKESARVHFKAAAEYCQKVAEADVDNVPARMEWAEALGMMEDFPQAIAVLEKAHQLNPNAAYKIGFAAIYNAWADAVARDPRGTIDQRLELLEKALMWNSADVGALTRLINMLGEKSPPDRRRIEEMMRRRLAMAGNSPFLHFMLGQLAYMNQDYHNCKLHYERAYELGKDTMPFVGNNLAWILAFPPPPQVGQPTINPDFSRALQMINSVLAVWPDVPTFRGTRGCILHAMRRYRDALPDLEACLAMPQNQNSPDIHMRLADVYSALGNTRMKEEHMRIAEEQIVALRGGPLPKSSTPNPAGTDSKPEEKPETTRPPVAGPPATSPATPAAPPAAKPDPTPAAPPKRPSLDDTPAKRPAGEEKPSKPPERPKP